MRTTILCSAITLCLALSSPLFSQSSNRDGCLGSGPTGIWLSSVAAGPPGTPNQTGIQVFSRDGTFSGHGSPISGGPPPAVALGDTVGQGNGFWERISPTQFRVIVYALIFKNGVVNGFFRVHDTLTLSDTGQKFTSVNGSQVEWLDLDWNVVASGSGINTGTRLESPSGCHQ